MATSSWTSVSYSESEVDIKVCIWLVYRLYVVSIALQRFKLDLLQFTTDPVGVDRGANMISNLQ